MENLINVLKGMSTFQVFILSVFIFIVLRKFFLATMRNIQYNKRYLSKVKYYKKLHKLSKKSTNILDKLPEGFYVDDNIKETNIFFINRKDKEKVYTFPKKFFGLFYEKHEMLENLETEMETEINNTKDKKIYLSETVLNKIYEGQ